MRARNESWRGCAHPAADNTSAAKAVNRMDSSIIARPERRNAAAVLRPATNSCLTAPIGQGGAYVTSDLFSCDAHGRVLPGRHDARQEHQRGPDLVRRRPRSAE